MWKYLFLTCRVSFGKCLELLLRKVLGCCSDLTHLWGPGRGDAPLPPLASGPSLALRERVAARPAAPPQWRPASSEVNTEHGNSGFSHAALHLFQMSEAGKLY